MTTVKDWWCPNTNWCFLRPKAEWDRRAYSHNEEKNKSNKTVGNNKDNANNNNDTTTCKRSTTTGTGECQQRKTRWQQEQQWWPKADQWKREYAKMTKNNNGQKSKMTENNDGCHCQMQKWWRMTMAATVRCKNKNDDDGKKPTNATQD